MKLKKLKEKAILPTYGSAEAAGADLYACLETPVTIQPGESVFIPTGLAMELPRGYAGLIYARSGLACKRGLAPANKVGVVDSDYRGEIIVALHNHGSVDQTVLLCLNHPSCDLRCGIFIAEQHHCASGTQGLSLHQALVQAGPCPIAGFHQHDIRILHRADNGKFPLALQAADDRCRKQAVVNAYKNLLHSFPILSVSRSAHRTQSAIPSTSV